MRGPGARGWGRARLELPACTGCVRGQPRRGDCEEGVFVTVSPVCTELGGRGGVLDLPFLLCSCAPGLIMSPGVALFASVRFLDCGCVPLVCMCL